MDISICKSGLLRILTEFTESSKSTGGSEEIQRLKTAEKSLVGTSQYSWFIQAGLALIIEVTLESSAVVLLTSLLKDKFKYDFDTLDELTVRESLATLQQIFSQFDSQFSQLSSKAKKTMLSNLSLILAYVYINYSSKVEGLFDFIAKTIGTNNTLCNLTVLECAATEIDDRRLVIDHKFRKQALANLQSQQKAVLMYLNTVGPSIWTSSEMQKEIYLRCFPPWVSINYDKLIFDSLPQHFAISRSIECLMNGDCSYRDAAIQCIDFTLKYMEPENEPLVKIFGETLFQLAEALKPYAKKQHYICSDNIMQIFLSFCSKVPRILLDAFEKMEPTVTNFLEAMASFIELEDNDAFGFISDLWIILINKMTNQQGALEHFRKIMGNLYCALCRRSQMSWSLFTLYNSKSYDYILKKDDEGCEQANSRNLALQIFEAMSSLLGQSNFLAMGLSYYQIIPRDSENSFMLALESFIFSMSAGLYSFPVASPELINLVKMCVEYKPHQLAIHYSYLGLYKTLLTIRDKNQELLKVIFTQITTAMNNSLLRSEALEILKDGCCSNPSSAGRFIDAFMALIRSQPRSKRLAKTIKSIVMADRQLLFTYLPQLFDIFYNSILEGGIGRADRQLEALSIILNQLQKKKDRELWQALEPWLAHIVNSLWPLLKPYFLNPLNYFEDTDLIIEYGISVLKYLIRIGQNVIRPYLEQICTSVAICYTKFPICSCLYFLQILICAFAKQPQQESKLHSLYTGFVTTSKNYLLEVPAEKSESLMMMLQDFFGLHKRMLFGNLDLLLKWNCLPTVFELAIGQLSQRTMPQVVRSASRMFEASFMVYWRYEVVADFNEFTRRGLQHPIVIENYAPELYGPLKQMIVPALGKIVTALIDGLAGETSSDARESIMDTLMAEIKAFPLENTAIWMPILQSIPGEILTRTEKEDFYQQITSMGNPDFQQIKVTIPEVENYVYLLKSRTQDRRKRKAR